MLKLKMMLLGVVILIVLIGCAVVEAQSADDEVASLRTSLAGQCQDVLDGLGCAGTSVDSTKDTPVSKIVFMSDRDGQWEIYVMDSTGANQTRLTNNTVSDVSPVWSPDGTKIAFVSLRDGNVEIYVMDADGANQTRLTANPGTDEHPAWSPDGTKIVWRSEDGVTGQDTRQEIHVMDLNGANQTRITDNDAWETTPSWSPDGTKIAFVTSRDGDWEIYVMNPDGSQQTNITNSGFREWHFNWSLVQLPPSIILERGLYPVASRDRPALMPATLR